MARVVCVVQARMGSNRLPGKVLRELEGKPMLSHLLERLKLCRTFDQVVVATSLLEQDRPVAELARREGLSCFCGDEDDVLSRYVGAACQTGAEVVVRITGDCPLIDPVTSDDAVRYFLANAYDYVAAGVGTGFPRGLDTEVFTREALWEADRLGRDNASREHVTYFINHHPEMFNLGYYQAPPELRRPDWRLCVDEEDDFQLIREIYRRLCRPGEIVDVREVVHLLDREPHLAEINSHIRQKTV